MIQALYRLFIELTNQRWTSLLLRRFARSKASKIVVSSFANTYKINQREMEKSLREYPTLHDLFTRKLKEGARAIDHDSNSVVSPVDAVIEDIGPITIDSSITVKGKHYSIAEMVGKDDILEKYKNGTYMILYLSPTHYHRIHSPISGVILGQWSVGTKSYPVNRLGLKYGKSPLSKNYRTLTEVRHALGDLLIVKVGAMFVNTIETIHEGEQLIKGEEMAYFSFGSTVVLLFEKDTFIPSSTLTLPADIKVGERIGTLIDKIGK